MPAAPIIAAVVALAATAYTAIESRRQQKKMRDQLKKANRGSEPSKYMFKNASPPKQIILGHVALSGPEIFACEMGEANDEGKGELIHIVVHLAGHPCEDVTDLWFDDTKLVRESSTSDWGFKPGPGGLNQPVEITNNADIKFSHPNGLGWAYVYLGNHSEPPSTLYRNDGSYAVEGWTDDMIGRDQCFMHMMIRTDPSKWPNGIPNPKAAVKGMKLYDPRTGLSQWSDNPALMVRWYRTALKRGVPIEESYITSANICDEWVETPVGMEKRYRCNYAFFADTNPREVLANIRAACGGESLRVAGRHAMQVGAYYGPSVITLTKDDIIGDIKTSADARRRDLINSVSATYVDPDDNWNESDMPLVSHQAYRDHDGYPITDDLDLTTVPSPYQAQRLALMHLLTSRDSMSIELTVTQKAIRLLPGSIFALEFDENGWDGTEFIVSKWISSVNGEVKLQAQQTKVSHYDYNGNTAIVPERPGLPSLIDRTVQPVTQLTYTELLDSNVVQAVVTWEHRSLGSTTFELSFYKNGEFLRRETTVDKQYRLQDGFTVGQYEIQVVAISFERRSAVTSLVFDTSAPLTPIGCDIGQGNWALELKPISAGKVNFFTMYDFAFGFAPGATDDLLEESIIGRAKVLTVSNLKADTLYQVAIREVSRWGMSGWFRTEAKTTFNSDDIWEVIYGDVDKVLNESLESSINQIEQRANALSDRQDADLNALLNEISDFHQSDNEQKQQVGLAYAEQKLLKHADEISAQASSLLELLSKYNQNTAYIQQLQNAVANADQALTESQEMLLAKMEFDDSSTLARANSYTRAAVGYCIDAQGNITSETNAVACVATEGNSWVEGPLSEFIRNLQIQNGSGQSASISNLMQVFESVDGDLVARGGMVVNNQGRVTGYVSSNNGDVTSMDIIAQYVRIGDETPNGQFSPTLYIDSNSKKMVFKGHLILDDGQPIKSRQELKGADGKDGTNGSNGTNGLSGTIWGALKLRNGVFPSSALASADFQARYGRMPIRDDLLTYVSDDETVSSAKSFDGNTWVQPALRLNGNLITPGSVYGDRFVAGTEIKSPVISAGSVRGGTAGFGEDGPYSGYHTYISEDGTLRTNRLVVPEGFISHLQLATGAATSVHSANSASNSVVLNIPSVVGSQALVNFMAFAWEGPNGAPPETYSANFIVYAGETEIYRRSHLLRRFNSFTFSMTTPIATNNNGFRAVITTNLSSSPSYGVELNISAMNSIR
ncbi:phage tail protein [Vibrio fluvialis]|uniref:phage tail protein n=1 Tax=Vibrio fluvialis TaxID=676 RepID=UPI003D7E6447